MRKLLTLTLAVFFCTCSLFAYTDSFNYLAQDYDYVLLLDSIKENDDYEDFASLYEKVFSSLSDTDKVRLEYHMIRYFTDRNEKEKASEHLLIQEDYFSLLENDGSLSYRLAELDYYSSRYYVDKKISDGLKTNNLTKELYKDYPEENIVALTEAFRLLNAPMIAGGSKKKAYSLFYDIYTNLSEVSKTDLFSLLSGLGMSAYENKEYALSKAYFNASETIYPADNAMMEYIENLEEKGY